MSGSALARAAFARERLAVLAALALLSIAGWIWLLMAPMPMPGPAGVRDWAYAAFTLVMWFVMMVAMMAPSVTPVVLLFARVANRAASGGRARTSAFVGGYFAAWLLFSVLATALQIACIDAGLIDAMGIAVHQWLAAALLAAAAAYQLTPAKGACLNHCRSPVQFLTQEYRPGAHGAWVMGVRHGLYCLGCCWVLMLLLFVFGVMDLRAVIGLSVLVLLEKLAPFGNTTRWATAAVLLIVAGYVLLEPVI
jgi:predicted metal-binding membrane protein